jgi:ADP-heptose:LPS heptosyltransferase
MNKVTTYALLLRAILTTTALSAAIYRGDKYQWHFDIHSHAAARAGNIWDATVNLIAEIFSEIPTNQDLQPFFPRVEYSWRIAQEYCQTLGLSSGEYVVINLSSYKGRNRWGDTQLRDTLGTLCSHGLRLLACGIADDIERYKSLLTEFNIPWYPPTRDIHQIAGIIAYARCVVTPDTGVLHLATALGTPLVGIYPSDGYHEHYWAPYRHPYAVQLIAEHGKHGSSIPAERIVDATLALLHQCQSTGANAVS